MTTKNFIDEINKLPKNKLKDYFEKISIKDLADMKFYFDDIYYNSGESGIPDEKYDILYEVLISRDKKYKEYIGAKLRTGDNRVDLPYWLGSMDKLKPEDSEKIVRWTKKFSADNYFISEKLDGVSCLLFSTDKGLKLYTRGDGKVGANISYLERYFNFIPSKLPIGLSVRGELIISKTNFKKYSEEFAAARQMVAGLVNAKTAREGLTDIDFIAYEIVSDKGSKISSQFEQLEKLGFKTALHTSVKNIDVNTLTNILNDFKKKSKYQIDGIIVQADIPYKRNISKNPEYAFAFKVQTEENIVPTEVLEVEWNLSKRGILKPKILIEPVLIDGLKIRQATAFNAKYIVDNGIGPGAIVKITRSGDVIPYIVSVEKSVDPSMPDVEYDWNETEVDIIPKEIDSATFCTKVITSFFTTYGIQYVNEATVRKLIDNGLDSVIKILEASEEDLVEIGGLGQKGAKRVYDNIHKGLSNVTLAKVMASSSLFGLGVGERKFELLLDEVPNLLTFEGDELFEKIVEVKGFSDITAQKIVDNMSVFLKFLSTLNPYIKFKKIVKKEKIDLRVVFTGFRNKELEEAIKEKGGEILSGVSKKTTHLLVADKDENTTKIKKAKELGIPILLEEEFLEIFKEF
jgi:DNA ligase (NAD+)